jgi:hypothetical protein
MPNSAILSFTALTMKHALTITFRLHANSAKYQQPTTGDEAISPKLRSTRHVARYTYSIYNSTGRLAITVATGEGERITYLS